MSYYSYSQIGEFGTSNPESANPLSVCAVPGLEAGFNNKLGGGGLLDSGGRQCQIYMGDYCSKNWDGVCEYLSYDRTPIPNMKITGVQSGLIGTNNISSYTKGQILLKNAASEKYLVKMSDNCQRLYEPFDPTTADSPLISSWVPSGDRRINPSGNMVCVPIYDVDEKTIDDDPLMNKILLQPYVALDILINICVNRLKNKTIFRLKGTKLYDLFASPEFQAIIKSGQYK